MLVSFCNPDASNVDVLHSRSTTWQSERQSFADLFFLYIVVSSNIVPSTQSLHHRAKTFQKIPNLLISSAQACQNPNPFSFLSTFPHNLRTQVVDEILQSFIPLRPRSRAQIAYSYLLSFTLQCSNPFPLALAILQRTLRSGCVPVPQTLLLLSSAWLNCRNESHSVSKILLQMQSIGYHPDCGTCNYLISSLCSVDQLNEAVKVLKEMSRAGCVPDLESFDTVIGAMCTVRRTAEAVDMIKELVEKVGLTPRQGTIAKVAAALRANRNIWRAVEMIEVLERMATLSVLRAMSWWLMGAWIVVSIFCRGKW